MSYVQTIDARGLQMILCVPSAWQVNQALFISSFKSINFIVNLFTSSLMNGAVMAPIRPIMRLVPEPTVRTTVGNISAA